MTHPLSVLPSKVESTDNKPWYHQGLRFECTGCGQCCSGGPGYTWVSDNEIIAIADYLKMDPINFVKKHVRSVSGNLALIEKAYLDEKGNEIYDCIFLKDKKCQIYPVRPTQCKTFPWWTQNLHTEKDWEEAATRCEGISKDAPLVDYETIQKQSAKDFS